ncbi:hypothetical protein FRC11_011685, partial [Ceratobasidium sp. 423]
MAASVQEGVPAPVDPEEDIGVLPQSGCCFCWAGKCYLLTYSQYVKSEDVGGTTHYDTIKDGGFPPLAAYQYLKKEQAAWEAHYGNLTEEFLQEQNPNKEGEGKSNHNADFTYAMEAPAMEEFLAHLRECQPRDLAMGFNGISAFAKYHYKDTSTFPEGVCPPKELK